MNDVANKLRERVVETLTAIVLGDTLVKKRNLEVLNMVFEKKIIGRLQDAIFRVNAKNNKLVITENSIKWNEIELMLHEDMVEEWLYVGTELIEAWAHVNGGFESLMSKFNYPTLDQKIEAVGFWMVVTSLGYDHDWDVSHFNDYVWSPNLKIDGHEFMIDTTYETMEILG